MSADESTVVTAEDAAPVASNGTDTPERAKPVRTRRRTTKTSQPVDGSPSETPVGAVSAESDGSVDNGSEAQPAPVKRARRRKTALNDGSDAAQAEEPTAPAMPDSLLSTTVEQPAAEQAASSDPPNVPPADRSATGVTPVDSVPTPMYDRERGSTHRDGSRPPGPTRGNNRDRQRNDRPDYRQDNRQGRRDSQRGNSGSTRERYAGSKNGTRSPNGEQRGAGAQYSSQSYVQPKSASNPDHISVSDLNAKSLEELYEVAAKFEVSGHTRIKRPELTIRILKAQSEAEGDVFGDGVLEIIEDGFGFLRGQRFLPTADDIYVSQSQIRRFALRTGDRVSGQVRPPKDSEKFFSLLRVEAVNGVDPEVARRRPSFDSLTPIFPLERIDLETTPNVLSTRLLDLVAPVGRGQRGLIVSPPKAGKTMLLKSIANGITANSPDMHLMVCLIGERPEEVTDMRRSIDGDVISSTFDEPVEDHAKVAEMALERAKRLVEAGNDVTILLDSITRLARAYNLAVPPSGRTLSGGMDPVALYPPKRFFGAARNIEGGGSLTVVATCLIDTGSRMDDVIYEEFKGTGNMELHLDRKLAERRIYPSIDIQRSGTRREELLLDEHALRQVWTMRRMVSMLGSSEGTELVLGRLGKTQTNKDFLETLNRDV